jgi:hypothetical protein
MTASFIHAAFDPYPYIVFSICTLAMGVVLEIIWTDDIWRRTTGRFARKSTARALYGSDPLAVASPRARRALKPHLSV